MRRREFISLLGGAAAVWPLASQAQQRERVRRIGVLMHLAVDDPDGQSRLAAFLQGLQEAGWAVGRNVAIEVRWAAADIESMNRFAKELVAHQPDLIFVTSTPLPRRWSKRPVPFRSFLYWWLILSVVGSSRVCRGRAVT